LAIENMELRTKMGKIQGSMNMFSIVIIFSH
jgi:hypothetical protein